MPRQRHPFHPPRRRDASAHLERAERGGGAAARWSVAALRGAVARGARYAAGLVAALTVAVPAPARAWDDVGHMSIALIAWERLSPATRATAIRLLRAAPSDAGLAQLRPNAGGPEARDRALFARAATWPDIVKDRRERARFERYNRGHWHYDELFWRVDAAGRPVAVPELRGNPEGASERIVRFTATVADRQRPDAQRGIELAWLLHLVGDIHQPLHTSSRVTAAEPRGDRGGNGVRLGSTNLHAVWDDALDRTPGRRRAGEGRGGRGGGRPAGGADARLARAEYVAGRLTRAYPAARLGAAVADTVVASWAAAGVRTAQQVAYSAEIGDGGPHVPEGYRDRVRAAAEPAAVLAGYRLAALLERVLGGR